MSKSRLVSIPDTAAIFGRGSAPDGRRTSGGARTSVYEMIWSGQLEAVKDGRRTLVTAESIERRLANLPRVPTRDRGE